VLEEIYKWANLKLNNLYNLGFTGEKIILDPGIGFGKNSLQSIELLQNVEKLRQLAVPILIGHSRKSFIKQFSNTIQPQDRDYETIAVSLAIKDKIDWLRVHSVASHMRSMVAYAAVHN